MAIYNVGDLVYVSSKYLGERKAKILDKYKRNGVEFYEVDIDGVGISEITENRISKKANLTSNKVKSFTERVQEELNKKKLNGYTTDENTSTTQVKKEVAMKDDENVQVPGGAPGPLSEEELNKRPKDFLNEEIVESMGAKFDSSLTKEKASSIWNEVTKNSSNKFTTCLEFFRGKVNDEKQFCNFLAQSANDIIQS